MFEKQMITLYNGLGVDESAHDGASDTPQCGAVTSGMTKVIVTTTEKGIRYPYLRLARLSPRRVMLTPA